MAGSNLVLKIKEGRESGRRGAACWLVGIEIVKVSEQGSKSWEKETTKRR